MHPLTELYDRLEESVPAGYSAGGPAASEPTAWAAIALARAGRVGGAQKAAAWLADTQQPNGSVGVTRDQSTPAWPSSLAILAWLELHRASGGDSFAGNIERAVDWSLAAKGRTSDRSPHIGHDPTIVGWSWAVDTHSWLEPTAMFVSALREAGYGDHPRVRDGARMLADRLLPSGGANYGNTMVLGQELLPHVQPSGIALWALAGEHADPARLQAAIRFLSGELSPRTTTASLAYAMMGLAAHNALPDSAEALLHAAVRRELAGGASGYKLALLALAAPRRQDSPLAQLSK